ncbi:MAG: hypothetical protein KDB27_33120 [Planctomycetales bacterium]|nr:hypothetical protein [Planctomycetales bacterium]
MSGEPKRKLGEGALAAAWRQGHKEIGQMLKAFPDSILIEEPGQMNNPTSHGVSQQAGYVQPVSSVARHVQDVQASVTNNEPQQQREVNQQENSIVGKHVQDVQIEPPEPGIEK